MSTDLELARADARRAYAEMEGIHAILLEHGCEPSPDGLRSLIERLSGEAEQMRATMTTPEGYVGQVEEAVAEEVERLRAKVEDLLFELVDMRRKLAGAQGGVAERLLFPDAALDCHLDDGPGKWWVQWGGETIAEADTPVEAVRLALLAIRDRERNATPPWLTEYELLRRAGLVEQGRRLLALALQDGDVT